MPRFLLISDAAAIARCSVFTVRRAAIVGALAFSRGTGRRFMFTEEAVLEWVRKGCPSRRSPSSATHPAEAVAP